MVWCGIVICFSVLMFVFDVILYVSSVLFFSVGFWWVEMRIGVLLMLCG